MSTKCVLSLFILAVSMAAMTAAAYIMNSFEISFMWLGLIIGGAVCLVFTLLMLIFNESYGFIALALVVNMAGMGLMMSTLYTTMEMPDVKQAVIVCGVALGWMLLYCFMTNLGYVREHHTGCMLLWALLLIGSALAFALVTRSPVGWYSLFMLAPALICFAGLAASAEGPMHHIANTGLLSGGIFFFLLTLVLHFLTPFGSVRDIPSISSVLSGDDDEPYGFCPDDD